MPPTSHHIPSTDGTRIHVREAGAADGTPLVFIHGWSQSGLCWQPQLSSSLAERYRLLAMDLRGHGMSEAPGGAGGYGDSAVWAADLRAVIAGLALTRPVAVVWSYGGLVAMDYVPQQGRAALGGSGFVGATGASGTEDTADYIGPAFLEHAPRMMAADQAVRIAATRGFLAASTVQPLGREAFETALAYNAEVRPEVKKALSKRRVDHRPALTGLDLPVLVVHGEQDQVVLPAIGRTIAETAPRATGRFYPDVGHCPFAEQPDQFNDDLAEFVAALD